MSKTTHWIKWLMNFIKGRIVRENSSSTCVEEIIGYVLFISRSNFGLLGIPSPKNQIVNTNKKYKTISNDVVPIRYL
jgi:hypothetical protein